MTGAQSQPPSPPAPLRAPTEGWSGEGRELHENVHRNPAGPRTAALTPFGMIAFSRSRPSTLRPIHLILDMVRQPQFKPQRENPMFADERAMRPLIPGVEARGDLAVPNEVLNDPAFPRLIDDRRKAFAPQTLPRTIVSCKVSSRTAKAARQLRRRIPLPVTMDLMRRGRERFNVYCAVCHGLGGYGDGMVARRAAEMQAAGAAHRLRLGRPDELS